MKHQYVPNMDRINKKLREIGSGKYLKLPEGKTKLRILPPADGEGDFWKEATLHYGFQEDNKGIAITCLESALGKPCPVCKLVNRMKESGQKEIKKVGDKLQPKEQYLMNVVDRSDGRIKIWSCSGKKLKEILSLVKDEDYGPGILDVDTGNDLSITREGTGFTTKYSEPRVAPRSCPVGIKGWEKKLHNLDAEVTIRGAKQVIRLLHDNYGDYMEELGVTFKVKGKKREE